MKSRLRVIVIAATTIVVVGIAAGFATAGDSGVSAGRQATKLTPGSYKINTDHETSSRSPAEGNRGRHGDVHGHAQGRQRDEGILHLETELCAPDLDLRPAAHVHLGAPGKAGKVVRPAGRALPFGTRRDHLGHRCRGRPR